MLLAIDAGNTNITIGVFDNENLISTFRLTTGLPRTYDELGAMLSGIIERNHVKTEDIDAAIISSVVPGLNDAITGGIKRYFNNINPLMVDNKMDIGIKIKTAAPEQIGADRLVDCAAAWELFGRDKKRPVLVLDFGTATTYDLVDNKGCFVAGVTSPGIRISANALWHGAAKLPEIEIKKPEGILAQETISSMQAGLFYGQVGQTEYIIKKMIEESGYGDVFVVATGGLGEMIFRETEMINSYDPDLTLKGLLVIYEKNR